MPGGVTFCGTEPSGMQRLLTRTGVLVYRQHGMGEAKRVPRLLLFGPLQRPDGEEARGDTTISRGDVSGGDFVTPINPMAAGGASS